MQMKIKIFYLSVISTLHEQHLKLCRGDDSLVPSFSARCVETSSISTTYTQCSELILTEKNMMQMICQHSQDLCHWIYLLVYHNIFIKIEKLLLLGLLSNNVLNVVHFLTNSSFYQSCFFAFKTTYPQSSNLSLISHVVESICICLFLCLGWM